MIKDFGFIIPQNCQFGLGALKKLPDFLKAAGSDNVMLISDRGLEAIGVVDKVRAIIKDAGLKYAEYLDVVPNPTTDCVDECAAQYKAAGCTAIIALGGGISRNELFLKTLQEKYAGLYEEIPYGLKPAQITACAFYNDSNLIGALYGHLVRYPA